MFKIYSGICLEHIKNKHIITSWMFGKHGYQNWMDYGGSSKTFIPHYYMTNMIVLLSKTVSRLEAQFLRFQRVAVLLLFFRANVRQ